MHRHILPIGPSLAIAIICANFVGADRVGGIAFHGWLQMRCRFGPAQFIIALPLHQIIEPLDLPDAVLVADIVIFVNARPP